MPAYIYTGGDARYYPSLGVEAKPAGDDGPATVAEFDAQPPDDGRWEPTKKKPTPPPAVEDAVPADDAKKED